MNLGVPGGFDPLRLFTDGIWLLSTQGHGRQIADDYCVKPFGRSSHLLQAVAVMVCLWLSTIAHAGKHPYQELTDQLVDDVKAILIRHGMPIRYGRENRWFKYGAGTDAWIGGRPSYTLYFYEAHQIPRAAQLEVIQYCMKLHESRGRRETIRVEMRMEAFEPRFFLPKPYFELTLNNMQ